jgi:hypothetical protein
MQKIFWGPSFFLTLKERVAGPHSSVLVEPIPVVKARCTVRMGI